MKNKDVEIGKVYRVKVNGSVQDVRISCQNPHGGWDGINLATKRAVRIKSPQRLRGLADRPAKRQKIVSLAEYEAQGKQDHQDAATTTARKQRAKAVANPQKADQENARLGDAQATSVVPKPHKARKVSGLDAAAQVLKDAGQPMRCKDIVETMLAKGLWKTGGKTPHATIYAAIIREIAVKGGEARFKKTDRGLFASNA
jgi:hypothetical protein